MAEDNIIFEEVKSPMENMKWDFPEKEESVDPNIIPGRYSSLYSELLDKCDPSKFMAEYDHDRIAIANDLYTKTNHAGAVADDEILKQLRKRAMTELGIMFSTEMIYEELTNLLRPSKYAGTEKFNDANDLYDIVINHPDDIEELERVKKEAKQKDFYPKPIPKPIQQVSQKKEYPKSNYPVKKEGKPESDANPKDIGIVLFSLVILIIFVLICFIRHLSEC